MLFLSSAGQPLNLTFTGPFYDLPNNGADCPANCRQIPWKAGSDVWNGGSLPNFTSVTCTGLTEGAGTTDNAAAIKSANDSGFTINLSANNLAHADQLADADIGPVVVVLPSTVHGNVKITTPAGRPVSVCPATYRDDVACDTCQLCQRQNRKSIVGFPGHGASKKRVDVIVTRNGKTIDPATL